MIINPQYLISNEIITFPETININKHLQQNGIDIDCIELTELTGTLNISEKHKESVTSAPVSLNDDVWHLKKGSVYEFNSSFEVSVPSNMGGSVIGRSTFNRAGILIRSSWFDSGFKGTLGGTIYCSNDCMLTKGTRIGQFIMHEAASAKLYDGQYQGKKS
jgi:deoxycytidine triphosphate deaminase